MGKGHIVTWALGHLVSLMEPDELDERYRRWRMDDLPILPEDIPLKVLPATRGQFAIVKKLMNDKDTAEVICATDAAREGELIFRYIYRMAGCKKPVKRLWISSMTDAAIRKGFEELRPAADYDALYESADVYKRQLYRRADRRGAGTFRTHQRGKRHAGDVAPGGGMPDGRFRAWAHAHTARAARA